jgi:hypothetical protein
MLVSGLCHCCILWTNYTVKNGLKMLYFLSTTTRIVDQLNKTMAVHGVCVGNKVQQASQCSGQLFWLTHWRILLLIWNVNTVIGRLSWFLWVSCNTYQYRDLKRWTSKIHNRPVVFVLESHPKQLTAIVKQFKHLFYPNDFQRSLVQSGNLKSVH